jgi:TatD DNase family protein
MELIDSHAHVDFPQFDVDREAVLERARQAGISTLLAIGTGPGPEKLDAAIPFAERFDWIYATVGIHPHDAKKMVPAHLDILERLSRHPRVLAWGEIGLDYHYDFSPRENQARIFQEQLALARAAKLPVVIHCRDAWTDCLDLLGSEWQSSALGGILHCFSGCLDDAQRGMDMGFLISFAGNATYPKAQNLRDVAREVPLDRLLVETDAPYLAPQSRRGKRNEPAFVAEVAQTLAVVRHLPVEELAAATAENFRRLLRINRTEEPRVRPGAGSSRARSSVPSRS